MPPAKELENPFLLVLRGISDETYEVLQVAPFAADPEQGKQRKAQISFKKLHDAIGASLPTEGAVLLLYLLLHGNRDFLEYCLSRTDADTLLLPLLRPLYEVRTLRSNQLYMLLIIILMLSQDAGFVSNAHLVILPSVPWYREKILHKISLGALLAVVLVRTVQFNIGYLHDTYVHTNCLASLANMAPSFRHLHPHAARCLVSLCDLLARKLAKLTRQLPSSAEPAAAAVAEGSSALAPPTLSAQSTSDSTVADELQTYSDYLRISLEVINLTLSAALPHNHQLVYALLERQQVFEPLRLSGQYGELIQNIDVVLEHFAAALQREDAPAHAAAGREGAELAPGVALSVDETLRRISTATREWSAERLVPISDVKFTYEQEASPEEFFTPYIWQVVFHTSGLTWQVARLILFPLEQEPRDVDAEAEAAAYEAGLPVLASIDVEEGACSEGEK